MGDEQPETAPPLPSRNRNNRYWKVVPVERESLDDLIPEGPEGRADDMFDALSSALRDHRDGRYTKEDLREALAKADREFDRLHEWISAGGPLPDPWRRHYAPVRQDADG